VVRQSDPTVLPVRLVAVEQGPHELAQTVAERLTGQKVSAFPVGALEGVAAATAAFPVGTEKFHLSLGRAVGAGQFETVGSALLQVQVVARIEEADVCDVGLGTAFVAYRSVHLLPDHRAPKVPDAGLGAIGAEDRACRKAVAVGVAVRVLAELHRVQHRAFSLAVVADPQPPVRDIATSLGYSDSSGFIRAFRRWTGFSPTEWRRRSN
jgi:AraC-like DNA-binding protein